MLTNAFNNGHDASPNISDTSIINYLVSTIIFSWKLYLHGSYGTDLREGENRGTLPLFISISIETALFTNILWKNYQIKILNVKNALPLLSHWSPSKLGGQIHWLDRHVPPFWQMMLQPAVSREKQICCETWEQRSTHQIHIIKNFKNCVVWFACVKKA